MARGRFISLEGPEGAGKSTHLAALAGRLRAAGLTVRTTREPGGTRLGEAIRAILQHDAAGEAPTPTAELLLFLACRAQLMDEVIGPALDRGEWVLSDRFCDSTFAYQGYGRGMDLEALRALNRFATHATKPDLTVLLDIPEAESKARVAGRGAADRFERERAEFHRRVAEGFRTLARRSHRIVRIDSTGSQEATAEAIWAAVAPLLRETAHEDISQEGEKEP